MPCGRRRILIQINGNKLHVGAIPAALNTQPTATKSDGATIFLLTHGQVEVSSDWFGYGTYQAELATEHQFLSLRDLGRNARSSFLQIQLQLRHAGLRRLMEHDHVSNVSPRGPRFWDERFQNFSLKQI